VPRRYPAEFRRKVLDLIEAGKTIAEVAASLGVSDQTIYNWRNQDRVDRGLRQGVTTIESVELANARRRIRELETELEVVRRANELLKVKIDPKAGGKSSPRS
jgi:transposase